MLSLKVGASGDLVFEGGELQMVSGPEEIAQSCRMALGMNKGEWFLNPELGIDQTKFVGKDVSREEMYNEIVSGLLQEPHIQTVDSVDFSIDRLNRTITVSFSATAADGRTITAEGVQIGG